MKFLLIALAISVVCVVAFDGKMGGSYGGPGGPFGGPMGKGRWEGRDGWYARRYGGRREYNDMYDNKNLDEMMKDKNLMMNYCKCMLEQGECSDGGWQMKCHMMEALQYGCQGCSDKQRGGMRKVMGYYMNNENELWQQMVQKYDPKKTYSSGYEKELKKKQ